MLKVDLITVGKLKEDYLRRACEEYQKRLGAFVKLQIIELPEGKMPPVSYTHLTLPTKA